MDTTKIARLSGPVAALSIWLGAQAALAGPVTFTQFAEKDTDNSFFFTNLTPSTQVFVVSGDVPVESFFSNISGLSDELRTNQSHLSKTPPTTDPATSSPGNTPFRPFRSPGPNKLAIIRDTPTSAGDGGRTNLRTVNYTDVLVGQKGANSATQSASTGAENVTALISNFPDASSAFDRDTSVSFTSLLPSLDTNGLFLMSFAGAGAGAFGLEPTLVAVPEPGSAMLLGVGLAAWSWRRCRRSRA